MPLSSQLVTAGSHETGPKGGSPYHLRGQNPAVSYRPPTPPPAPYQHRRDPMLEQMDVTDSSWPGPGFMEPMFPSAPTPPPSPSMPMEESRSSKPKAKKKKKAAKKARPKARKKSAKKAKKKKAGKKKRRR